MRTIWLCAAALAAVSCGRGGDGAEPGPDRPSGDAKAARTAPAPQPEPSAPRVVLQATDGTELSVAVEVVREPRERRRGLMYRQHLPPDQGMLFLFDIEENQSFWMKNTLIPLDMIFIGSDMKIVGIVENAEPMTTEPRAVDAPSIYVLEVNGGWTRAHDVDAGSPVRFENVPR